MNNAYFLEGEEIKSRPVSSEELAAARGAAQKEREKANFSLRSCWICNPAHKRFLEDLSDGFLFQCAFGCGHWYYQGVDITNLGDAVKESAA